MSMEGMSLRNSEEQSLSLEMALQQEGWGATAFFNTSITHFATSGIDDMQGNKEKSSVTNESSVGAIAVMRAIEGDAEMAMQTRNTSTNFIVDAFSDIAAIVGRKLSVKGKRRIRLDSFVRGEALFSLWEKVED